MDTSIENAVNRPSGETRTDNCDRHGPFQARQLFGRHYSRCPTCEQELEDQREAAEAERKRLEREAQIKQMLEYNLRNCGLVGRNQRATFDNFAVASTKQRHVLDAVKQFAATFTGTSGGGLWLLGPTGTGKTHLGAALVTHVIRERGMSACMHSFNEIQTALRARWASNKEPIGYWAQSDGLATTDQFLEHLGTRHLLVIDEIGVSRGTDNDMEILFQIVDRRYQLERPTVVLSNLTTQELKAAMGDRSYDRLREGARLLTCDWDSHRGNARREPAASQSTVAGRG